MITTETIESFVETRSSTCREVFSLLVTTDDPTKLKFLNEVANKKIAGYAKSAGLIVGSNWQKDLSQVMTIEELFLIVEAENKKDAQSTTVKFFALFRSASNKMIELVTGVDLSALPIEQQFEAGDGMFLAALYHAYR